MNIYYYYLYKFRFTETKQNNTINNNMGYNWYTKKIIFIITLYFMFV